MAIDLFVMDTLYAFIFIVTTGMMEGLSLKTQILPTLWSDYVSLLLWLIPVGAVLAPLRIYLFQRISVLWRVLISDLADLLWTVLACVVVVPASAPNRH